MDKHNLIVTILGALFGAAIVLLFSFVVAERLKMMPPPEQGPTAETSDSPERDSRSLAVQNDAQPTLAVAKPYKTAGGLRVVPAPSVPEVEHANNALVYLLDDTTRLIDKTASALDETISGVGGRIYALSRKARNHSGGVLSVRANAFPRSRNIGPVIAPVGSGQPVTTEEEAAPADQSSEAGEFEGDRLVRTLLGSVL